MFRFYKYLIVIIIQFYIGKNTYGQSVFYQDVFQGGVTGAGYSFCLGSGTGSIPVFIEPGSTIRKAYLISYRGWYDPMPMSCDFNFIFNSDTLQMSDANKVTSNLINPIGSSYFDIHAIDVTSNVSPSVTNYTLTMPVGTCFFYNSAFLVILYENLSLGNTSTAIMINEKDNYAVLNYFTTGLNPISISKPVGFSVYTDRIDTAFDNVYIQVNADTLGLLGGPDTVNLSYGCGVKGNFYYQDSTLFGLDDDTPDSIMGGSDGLADIKNYLINNSTNLSYSINCQNIFGTCPYSNYYPSFHLAYTSPCDTFTAGINNNNTILCYGDSIQLSSFGGIRYQWKPSYGLSCDTCANPIANPDTSTFYTVQVWNTDSCSKIFPIKINVREPITFLTNTTPVTCGLQDGSIFIFNTQNAIPPLTYIVDGNIQPGSTATGLDTGVHIVTVVDNNGCSSTSVPLILNDTIYVTSNFTASPLTGFAPLITNFNYTGNNGTNFIWDFGNGDSSILANPTYIYNTSGNFVVTLVAWANDSSCSDTSFQTLLIDPSYSITQLVTPNNDGKNDTWIINGLSMYPNASVEIFNRWGNLVYNSEPYQNDWAGQCTSSTCIGNNGTVPAGTYFYTFYPNGKSSSNQSEIKTGYLEFQP